MIDCAISQFAFVVVQIGKFIDSHNPGITALAGIAVAIFTYILAKAAARADKHFAVTERAYVKMSHITPKPDEDGQALNWSGSDACTFSFIYEVKNYGRTPARVTGTGTAHEVVGLGQTLTEPTVWDPYEENDPGEAFLVCNDHFVVRDSGTVTVAEKAAIQLGTKNLIILGFVDYIDQFGVRHRGGYAREWVRGPTKHNLVFPDGHLGVNYDRERIPGEGIDWD